MESPEPIKQLCCYCGVNEATTRDHIPPRAIFTKPYPSNLITVPSCFVCNNNSSKYEEVFRTYLGLHVARFGGEGERLFKAGAIPTVKYNGRIRKEIIDRVEEVEVITPAGIYTGNAKAVLWNSEAHEKVIEKIVRGLFYFHYNKILPSSCAVEIYWFQSFHSDMVKHLYMSSVGNDFIYFQNAAEDCENESMWIFEFYGAHWAGAVTKGNAL